MKNDNDIVIVTDYHAKNIEFRWYDRCTGEERTFNRATEVGVIQEVLGQALPLVQGRGGQVVWIMESTTGWARVQQLLGGRAQFLSVNVLQISLPPKARRKKSDRLDTARILREYLHGSLPRAYEPDRPWREARRLVSLREDLVHRSTATRNRINAYFAHETWEPRGFWSQAGMKRLKGLIGQQPSTDRFVLEMRVEELEELMERIERVEDQMDELYRRWPAARRLDSIRGIGPIGAVTILARIGDIGRFADADELIGYAGLAPGMRQSDSTVRHLSIGKSGTDGLLRTYLIEASVWAREIPRYRATYERHCAKKGEKVARIVVARMLLRSIYKMLHDDVAFKAAA